MPPWRQARPFDRGQRAPVTAPGMAAPPLLPSGFVWGWAVAGTEVEGGGLSNQWTEWSERHAGRLAAEAASAIPAGRPDAAPPRFAAEATDPDNYRLTWSAEMWSRYGEDFRLACSLGFDAAQISVEWSRVEPRPGVWDEEALACYVDMVATLRASGQEPFVALWHFGNPLWFEERGGWRWDGAALAFARFTSRVVEALGDRVKFYITVVEPKVYSARAHLFGQWPPGQRSLRAFFEALDGFARGHRAAYSAVKDMRPDAQVGASVNDMLSSPSGGISGPLDRLIAAGEHWSQDRLFRTRIAASSDWLGLNYYMSRTVRRGRFIDLGPELSDVGWSLHPEGVLPLLLRLRRFGLPVYVTEFGVADAEDRVRLSYVDRTLLAIRAARVAGVDVRGAFYWSLLDNYEWDKGYWPRFGLVEVDRYTLTRRPRPSAGHLAQLLDRHRDVSPRGAGTSAA